METKIKKIQTAIFTRNFNILNDLDRAESLTEINKHASSIFNGQPTMFPIPSDAPQEFPRFVLNSLDGKFSCNIAPMRTDIFYNVPDESSENSNHLLETQRRNIENIFTFFISKGIIVNRVGFVVFAEKILSTEEGGAINFLKNNFIRDNKLDNPKELSFRYNKPGSAGIFEMNNLITVEGRIGNIIMIQTDINTVTENMEKANFNLENFNEIIDYAIQGTQEFVEEFF